MIKPTLSHKTFNVFLIVLMIVIALIMIIPLLSVLCLSLEPENIAADSGVIHLIPKQITFVAYQQVFKNAMIKRAFLNSVIITSVGAVGGVIATAMLAYGLSFDNIMGHKFFSYFVLFTMMFSGGTIPMYLLIKKLGMIDSLWSLILPTMITAYNVVLMRTFFEGLPKSLAESAMIDGASEFKIFFKIILPLSKPILATIFLFYAVAKWNEFFTAVLYINDNMKVPLQVVLRNILLASENAGSGDTLNLGVNVKMTVAVVAMVPIMCIYPFLQKYFTKGTLLGAVKG